MDKIFQCRMNKALKNNFSFFMKRFSLLNYKNKNQPCIFFGAYWNDIESILNHNSLAIVIWRGSDILKTKNLNLLSKKNVKHVAVSSFIEKDLKKYNIPHKFLPLTGTDINLFVFCPLGNEIYTYIPKNKEEFYGKGIVNEIQKNCKFKINIITGSLQYSKEQLLEIYKRCFIGLRLTPHDGLSNTVIELGLMGRKCIHNDLYLPNAIKWQKNNIDDIMLDIEEEAKSIGKTNEELSNKMKEYINVGIDWLNIKYWE
jgi:hypothetical protein